MTTYAEYYGATFPAAGEVLDSADAFGPTGADITPTYHAPEAAEVLSTAVFGAASATSGTVVLPAVEDVEDGVFYGPGSTLEGTLLVGGGGTFPSAANVLEGVVYGPNDTDLTGTYHAPEAAEVISTAAFGVSSGTAGTVVQATTTDVRSGVTYGPSSSLTGSLIVSGGNALSTDDINNLARAITKVTPRIKAASANEYELIIGDTFSQEIETVSATEFVFSIKSAASDPDADAILLISSLTGLEVVNGEAYGTAGHGSIVFAGGTATITVNSQVTDDLTAGDYVLTLKGLASGADKTWENAAKVSVVVGGVAEVTL